MEKEYLSIKEQIELLKKRGMIFKDEEEATKKLTFINYYKIKEASLPFFRNNKYLENTTFENIIFRFYEDRNLRLYFMRIIEKIEISLKTNFSRILGREYGEVGYLNFKQWTDNDEYCKYYIKYKQKDFNIRKIKSLHRSENRLLKEYSNNINKIPVWLIVDTLTFGEILELYKLMKMDYKKEIAQNHNISVSIFISWLENINLIRNLSAHNSNVLDVDFKTKPKILNEWKNKSYINESLKLTGRIANTILIMEHLIVAINDKFPGNAIKKCLLRLYNKDTNIVKQIGFRNLDKIKELKI